MNAKLSRNVMTSFGRTMHFDFCAFLLVIALLPAFVTSETSLLTTEVVCPEVDIRNSVSQFQKLVNCTVVEGHVKIILMENETLASFEDLSFRNLREITGYLLLYRVNYMKTLSNIFPNLSVIRGQQLFFNYALVIYEMTSLEELGLASLTLIERGAVYVERNYHLCYLETIDWSSITASKEKNIFLLNQDSNECANIYPNAISDCPTTHLTLNEGQEVTVPLCWKFNACQIVCPSHCDANACYNETDSSGFVVKHCCHHECVGGCSGPTDSDCFVCRNITYKGRCMRNCPPGMYEVNQRRCLNRTECEHYLLEQHLLKCSKMSQLFAMQCKSSPIKLLNTSTSGKDICLASCPPGFSLNSVNQNQCFKCVNGCPKTCPGKIVDNMESAQSLEACTVIDGSLEIQFRGGNVLELEKYLGQIEEVTHFVRIIDSYVFTNLQFLKSLRLIRGRRLYDDKYAFLIFHNLNLEDIWDLKFHPNLIISNGQILFRGNQMLCVYKIRNFLSNVSQKHDTDDMDNLSGLSNGNRAMCDLDELPVLVEQIGQSSAVINWSNYSMKNRGNHISWVIHYSKVNEGTNITMDILKEVCSAEVWKSLDVKADITNATLLDLKAFTKYVVYVRAYTISSVTRVITSPFAYFTTKVARPSPVRNLIVKGVGQSELLLTWEEPDRPNGIITHYIVSWHRYPLNVSKYEKRNYCDNKIQPVIHFTHNKVAQEFGTSTEMTAVTVATTDPSSRFSIDKCCACPKSAKQLETEEKERKIKIAFEDFLQDTVFLRAEIDESKGNQQNIFFSTTEGSSLEILNFFTEPQLSNNSTPEMLYLNNSTTVSLLPNNSTSDSRERNEISVVETNITLSDLTHFQEYWIQVTVCQGDIQNPASMKLCSFPEVIIGRTKPDDSADSIDGNNVTVFRYSPFVTHLHWSPPSRPNALIVAYEIELSNVNIQFYKSDIWCMTSKDYRKRNGMSITRTLSPGNWSYRVRAVSLAGNGPWTSMQYLIVDAPDQGKTESQYLAAVAVVPLLIITLGLVSFYIIRYKRRYDPKFISYNPEYVNPEDLYVADEWEVDRDCVTLLEALGQGSFGMVYRGLFQELGSSDEDTTPLNVAIKTVNESSTLRDRIAFLQEASVMKAFDSHHVVKLFGIVSKGQPHLVIMELMSNGDLKTFLRRHRPDEPENDGRRPPTLKRFLQMAGEIADGMAYLASGKFVHRDLAARNCMVSLDMTVKIGDFGLTRDIYATDYYHKKSRGLLPVRWMAPESLKDGIFSSYSDVWSYGIVLWEMATLATQPYQGLSNEEVLEYVTKGGKMAVPDECPEKLEKLMLMCWNMKSEQRPTFIDIIEILLPDLDSKFSTISYYFLRTQKDAAYEAQKETEEKRKNEEEEIEVELEENSRTPLNISFSPATPNAPLMRQLKSVPNGIGLQHKHLGQTLTKELHLLRPASEHIGDIVDYKGESSLYPDMKLNEGISVEKENPFQFDINNVKSRVNFLARLPSPLNQLSNIFSRTSHPIHDKTYKLELQKQIQQ